MTRRDLVVACVGTSLGLSGCKGMSRSGGRALGRELSRSGGRIVGSATERSDRNQSSDSTSSQPDSSLSRYPALKAYIQEMQDIPAGTFRFGFYNGQTEAAPHVEVSAFRMGTTPITWAIWKEYCDAESVKLPEEPLWGRLGPHPVVNVSYNDIVGSNGGGGFCGWVSRIAGFTVSLPTSKQWEYAARGGEDGFDFPWGNEFDITKLWCSKEDVNAVQTAAVDRNFRIYQNAYGLTDMVGNVWEKCSNDYEGGKEVRGGSWDDYDPDSFRCANRFRCDPDGRYIYDGFRLVAPA